MDWYFFATAVKISSAEGWDSVPVEIIEDRQALRRPFESDRAFFSLRIFAVHFHLGIIIK